MSAELSTIAFAIGAIVVLVGGVVAGYIGIDRSFRRDVVTEENARELLKDGNVSAWNAFRRLNPEWRPTLRGADFAEAALPEVDLKNAELSEAIFRSANLDGADFSGTNLAKADFTQASLRRAVFDDAVLTDANFSRAALHEASLRHAELTNVSFEGSTGRVERQRRENVRKPVRSHAGAEEIAALSPSDFEQFVASLLSRLGYDVEMSASTHDAGVDMIVTQRTPLADVRTLVQVKRLSDPTRAIGQEAVRALEGVRLMYPAEVAMLITNGRFSRSALETAAALRGVRLVDGTQLAELQKRTAG